MRFKGIPADRSSKSAIVLACLAGALAANEARAQAPYLLPYTINTVAGGGTAPKVGASCPGPNGTTSTAEDTLGDGCLASSSSIVTDTDLHDVGADPLGNLYFIDIGTYTVLRRIDARSGIVNVAAGSVAASTVCATTIDAYGDGCPASDGKGNAAGTTTAKIGKSRGIAVAKNGDVYIADYGVSLVHKISASTGLMTLVAGYLSGGSVTKPTGYVGTKGYTGDGGPATSAELNSDRGVAVDASGNVYIADSSNNVVRMVNPAGIISTIVGKYPGSNTNAPAGATGDGGPATQATLSGPEDVEVDANGNLFIGDFGNNKVRVVYAGGTTVANLIALTNPGTTAVAGDIYTVMGGGTGVYAPGTMVLATSAAIGNPRKLALDARGNIYLADNTNDVVMFLDASTGFMRTLAGTYGKTSAATCPTQTDTLGDNCAATLATLNPNSEMGVGVGPQGDVYISDSGDARIRKVAIDTSFPAVASGSAATQTLVLHFATGDTQAAANAFVVSGSPDFTAAAPACTLNADTTTDCTLNVTFSPTRPGFDLATLTVTSLLGRTAKFALSGTGTASSVALDPGAISLLGTGLSNPAGIAQDAAGNAYVADTGNNRVMRYTGTTSTVLAGTGTAGYSGDGGPATAAKLSGPKAVAVTPDGAIYIADTGNNVLRRIDPITGLISTYGGAATALCATPDDTLGDGCPATQARFSAPSGLASDALGNLYVTDTGNNVLREIGTTGYVFLTAGGASTVCGSDVVGNGCLATQAIFKSPTGLQIDTLKDLYIADTGNNEVRELASATNLVSALAGTGQPGGSGNGGLATTAQVNGPTGLAVDAAGNVYIADTGNHVVRVVTASGTINSVVGTLGSSGTGTVPGTASATLLNAPAAVAATGSGNLYVLDSGNSRALALSRGAAAVNFGRTNLGTSSPTASILETSTGSATATLGYPLFTSSGSTGVFSLTPPSPNGCSSSSSTPQTLTPGASCGLTAQFTPTAAGQVTATYTESNATTLNSPAPSIALTGTGAVLTPTTLATAVTTPAIGSPQYSISFVVTSTLTPKFCDPTAPNCSAAGTVTFSVDGTQVGLPVPVSNSSTTASNVITASQTINGQSVGPHAIVAVYSGDTYYASSTAPTLNVSVAQGSTTTVVTPSPATLNQFAALTLTAQVTSATTNIPTGSVTFYAGSTVLGTAGINPTTGIATLNDTNPATTLGLIAGTYSITGVYSGDSNYAGSTSKAASLTVSPDPQGFTLSLSSATVGTAQGSTAQTQVYITPTNTLNGSVSFACSGLPTGSVCTVSPTSLTFTPVPGAPAQQSAGLTLWTDVAPGVIPTSSSLLGWPVLLIGFAGTLASRRRLRHTLGASLLGVLAVVALLAGSATVLTGCLSAPQGATLTPPGTYKVTLTVTGPASTVQSTPITFTVAAGAQGQL
jgi:sugar lactone lactonase YvrE